MPWFRLDDSFHSHPKILKAGNEAVGFYVRCGTYAAEHLTDGFIDEQVALQYGTPALIETLVKTKLWRRTRGGWRMPDYLDYNPSKQAVDKERKAAAERQRRHRSVTSPGHNRDTGIIPVGKLQTAVDNSGEISNERQNAWSDDTLSRRDSHRESHDPDPTRPDPNYNGGTGSHHTRGKHERNP